MKQAAVLFTLALALAGCATIDGIGQDVSSASRNVQSWF
ncbi:entericidin EcnA/B family protein [Salipiger sp.]